MSKKEKLIKAILVDDHAIVRAGIRQFLELTNQIQVIAEAGDGEEIIRLLEKNRPDIVVLDIQMPRKNGIEVTRWIHQNKPDIGILVLTAYDEDPYIQAILKAGADGYVLKTSEPEEIVRAVLDVHAGKAVMDSTITRRLMERIKHPENELSVEMLTNREIEVLTLVAKGQTNKAIGVSLNISNRTVQNHLAHIFEKLQAASRTEAVMRAMSTGIIPSDLINN